MQLKEYSGLTIEQQQLIDEAEKALAKAYAPYSRFLVGAALQAKSGLIISAANLENASYGACICAERSTLAIANAQGIREFLSIAIIGRSQSFSPKGNIAKEVVSPCGICRQMLFEAAQISDINLEVIMSTGNKSHAAIATIQELLPYGFGPNNLGIDL